MAFLFYLIITVLVLFFIIMTSKIQVEISNLKYLRITNKDFFSKKIKTNKKIDFLIKFRIYLIGKIPFIKFEINKENLNQLEKKKTFQKIQKILRKKLDMFEIKIIEDLNNRDKKIFNDILNSLKNKKIKVKKIDMDINLGLENIIATTMMIPIVSTAISFLLQNLKIDTNKSKYKVVPVYNLEGARNRVEVHLNCTFEVKMIMKKFSKKIPKKVLTFN